MKTLKRIKIRYSKHLAALTASVILAANFAQAQDPGGNPDGPPPAVPFDDYMMPILLLAGVAIAFIAIVKNNKRALKSC